MYTYLIISSVCSSELQYKPTQKKFSIFGKLLTEKRNFSKLYLYYGLTFVYNSSKPLKSYTVFTVTVTVAVTVAAVLYLSTLR